jgi:pimeloyl-ACP methyl ester carboxylesterase
MNLGTIIFLVLIMLIVVLVAWYWRDRTAMIAKIKAEGRIIHTARGPMEYASFGDGPAVLSVHGWGGGGSGGYNMFRFLADHGFKVISLSRPGYLGTPLSVGETMEQQADAFAALLDALNLTSAAVICGSGGGPSSLLFALRHPDRCWALVLVDALLNPEPVTNTNRLQEFLEPIFRADFLIWIIAKFFWRGLVESGMGELNEQIRNDPNKVAILRSLIYGLITSSLGRDGMRNDMIQWRKHMPKFNFADVKVPTFIVHAKNDKSIPFHYAEKYTTIPGSKLLTFEDGGHTCFIVYSEVAEPATLEFLRAHQPL